MSDRFRFGPPDLLPTIVRLVAASVAASLAAPWVPSWVWQPNPLHPWTFLVATLVHVTPFDLVWVVVAVLLSRRYFDGELAPVHYAGLWFGCGALGHLVAGAQMVRAGEPFVAAAGLGGTASVWALAAGYSHFNGRQMVKLYDGIMTLELRDLALAVFALQLAAGVQLGAAGAHQAGRAAAGLAAYAWFRRDDWKAALA